MAQDPAKVVPIEHFLDVNTTWRRKMYRRTIPLYVLMRPGEHDVTLSVDALSSIDPRLPLILAQSLREFRSKPDEAGLLVRSNLQMFDRLAPPGLPASFLSPEMHYLCDLKEVHSVGATEVRLVGHILDVCDDRYTERMAVGVRYWENVGVPIDTFEEFCPGVLARLKLLVGLGLSPAELANQMFAPDETPSDWVDLPDYLSGPSVG